MVNDLTTCRCYRCENSELHLTTLLNASMSFSSSSPAGHASCHPPSFLSVASTTPTLRGITADRTSSFRCGLVRESCHKAELQKSSASPLGVDLRHLSSSEGVAAALQMASEMDTPRSLSYGRAPTTLQVYDQAATPQRRPITPRKAYSEEVDAQVPLAAHVAPRAEGFVAEVLPPPPVLLSSRAGSLTRSGSAFKPRPWSDHDLKPRTWRFRLLFHLLLELELFVSVRSAWRAGPLAAVRACAPPRRGRATRWFLQVCRPFCPGRLTEASVAPGAVLPARSP
ncbi:unnamed protein product [Durusdinium trenchii]|uniref:Uncharacterized protein n=1 Tax=Durusdinium trenchii TaxID=1381693 RepID=A0ABP0Q1K7_9DINO